MTRKDRPADGLWASYDQKVSPRQGWQGPWRSRPGRHIPRIGNSFGLPAGATCPGRTAFCLSCYGIRAERNPGVAPALTHNLELLLAANRRTGITGMADLLEDMLVRYDQEARHLDPPERIFRIHWDGDFFSTDYARAWADTIRDHPAVRFWCYTRSFRPPVDVIPILYGIPNLALYLSVDEGNRTHAAAQLAAQPTLMAAYCADDYQTARAIAGPRRDRNLTRPTPCPENAHRIPIADAGQGACVSCQICPEGRRDILFATSHREDAAEPVRLILRPTDTRPDIALVCKLPACRKAFTRPPGTKGKIPDYCSRACQVKGYTAEKKARAAGTVL